MPAIWPGLTTSLPLPASSLASQLPQGSKLAMGVVFDADIVGAALPAIAVVGPLLQSRRFGAPMNPLPQGPRSASGAVTLAQEPAAQVSLLLRA